MNCKLLGITLSFLLIMSGSTTILTAQEKTEAPKATPPVPVAKSFLEQEQAFLAPMSEFLKNIKPRTFAKRLPRFFNDVDITKNQKAEIYRIQKEYNDVTAILLARINQLNNECNQKMTSVLTEEQKKTYQKLVDEDKAKKDKTKAEKDKAKAEKDKAKQTKDKPAEQATK